MTDAMVYATENCSTMSYKELERRYAIYSRLGDDEVCDVYLNEIDRRAALIGR